MAEDPTPERGTRPANPNLIRDHLANERTLLAWLRTGMAVAGLGFLVARFGIDPTLTASDSDTGAFSEAIGIALIAGGAAMTGLGAIRYRRTTRWIDTDTPPRVGRLEVVLGGGFVVVAVLLILAILRAD
jgi:putative membrane protein